MLLLGVLIVGELCPGGFHGRMRNIPGRGIPNLGLESVDFSNIASINVLGYFCLVFLGMAVYLDFFFLGNAFFS